MTDPWTLKKMLLWSSQYFQGKGIETPRLDAELLLAHLLNLRRLDLYLQFERPLTKKELLDYKALIKRHVDHEPVAYITGKKEFWSLDFFVTPDVLIPRPDTEVLIEKIVDSFKKNKSQPLTGIEVGLGAGNISVTLLSEFSGLNMQAYEISSHACAQARKNADYHGVTNRLTVLEQDFLQQSSFSGAVDFVVSNPPYVRSGELSNLPPEVKDHEPHKALDGGKDGLVFYRKIIEIAKPALNPEGFVAVEIGEDQAKAVTKIFQDHGYSSVTVHQDLAGRDRVVMAYG